MRADPAPAAKEAATPAEVAGEDTGAEAKEEKTGLDKDKPTVADVKAANEAVLAPKPMKIGSEFDRTMAEAQATDAQEALDVAKHDAIGKGIISDMYKKRAQDKLDDAEKKRIAEDRMVEILQARQDVLDAQEKARQAAAFKAHKAHVLHVKEHYAGLEAKAAAEVAAAHEAWKAKYGAQKRLPLGTPAETWTANMPEHVMDDPDFHIKAPAPIDKLLKDAKKAEDAAEEAAKPAPAKPIEVPKVPTAAEAEADLAAKEGKGPPVAAVKEAAAEAAAAEAAPAFVQIFGNPHRLSQKKKRAMAKDDDESESSDSDSGSDSDSDSD